MTISSVAVVGGGLVGAVEACLLARRGFKVTLFESRHDGRNEPSYYGRSINLAISLRGISALKRLELDQVVLKQAIPMKARMIHNPKGRCKAIPYDPDGRCINSIERAALNNYLLNQAEQHFKVKILFNHKLVDMNAEKGELMFRLRDESEYTMVGSTQNDDSNNNLLIKYKFDLILGCDGSRSSVRSLLSRQCQFDVSQSFIEHGYLELRIDPAQDKSFKMPPNYLHIWPRGQYMMIALPNKDSSFTCTLFMPFKILDELRKSGQILRFFEKNFPDSIQLIGAKQIEETFSTVRASSLISIKCKPYHYKSKVALLGDSAHAMVPFYGQGMNCGFEDCLVLDELFDKYLGSGQIPDSGVEESVVGKVLQEYSEKRCANGQSMSDLAMYNYIEMRDLVNTWSFRMRKYIDDLLYRCFSNKWIPLYTMVTFSRIPVDECVRRRERQDKILARCYKIGLLSVASGLVLSGLLIRCRRGES